MNAKAAEGDLRPREAEKRSRYPASFQGTMNLLEKKANRAFRWGIFILIFALLLFPVGGVLFGNNPVVASELEGLLPGNLRGPAHTVAWASVVLAFIQFAYRFLLRSWELEDKLMRTRLGADCADFSSEEASEITKAFDKETERAAAIPKDPIVLKLLLRRWKGRGKRAASPKA